MKSTQILALVSALGSLASAATAAAQARFDTLYSFTNGFPVGFVAANGVLFGGFQGLGETGVYCGTVFELKPPAAGGGAWTQAVLYSFAGADTDGCVLALPPVWANGALYGTTVEQGAYDMGVVYELQPPGSAGGEWTESVLYKFSPPGTKVGYAVGNLIPGQDGSFYMLTSSGVYGAGALTRLQPPEMPAGVWNPSLLYSFPKLAPAWGLTEGDGVFYATTLYGPDNSGLILQLTPPAAPGERWTETQLYALAFGQGATPNSLTLADDGTLYGTTYGTNEFGNGPGTAFSLTPPASRWRLDLHPAGEL
jgi:hypothetical protein